MLKNSILVLFLPLCLLAEITYKVEFLGLEDKAILSAVKETSDLLNLQKRPPASLNSLRYRIESDIPTMIETLHAFAYYDAAITSNIETENDRVLVYIFIHPGSQYPLKSYEFFTASCQEKQGIPECENITLESLGIQVDHPAYARMVLDSESNLLYQLANCGYPLASIEKREVLVDTLEKNVRVRMCIATGPKSYFGPISIHGLKDVKTKYIVRKILWNEGDLYREDLVQKTQERLIDTDLFGSVLITHENQLDALGQLPIKIRLSESKHKTVSAGVSYATIDGPGVTFAWENRNVMKMGQTLSVDVNVSKIYSDALARYTIPDFFRMDQYYVWQFKADRQDIRVYTAKTYSLMNRLERKFDDHMFGSIGIKGEYINVKKSIRNGNYALIGLPIYYRHSYIDNILNPLSGYTVVYYGIPYQAVTNNKTTFVKQTLTTTAYFPLIPSKRIVLAFKTTAGAINGAALNSLPMTKRFFGGSDDELRGYSFHSVSPLNKNGKPAGGRGVIYETVELRFRLTDSIGIVPFADFGNVTTKAYPRLWGKWFKSLGVGLRYFLFFGPLRVDVGFPLDRRRFDPRYKIYVSVGQMF